MPIAIVGIGCRFPGGVTDPASFWQLLRCGGDAITEIPADRFDINEFFDERPATPGRIISRFGGFLGPLDRFDAAFFGLSPAQAERMDPQQRLLLETTWEALEDAGLDVTNMPSSGTSVFVGQWVADFENRLFADPQAIDFPMTLGSGRYAASGRISYAFGFRGPSLTVDAACSAGLASVHLAVRSLWAGDGKIAIAGGVNVIQQPHIHIAYSQSRMMAPDGRCKFGDASADGYVRSEGAGIVVLMPLDDALAGNHRVYAVIRGSALNNDGDSSGSMGRPSAVGQTELLRAAYRDANVDPSHVHYVEAHGTGTRAGDPVEFQALAEVLAGGRKPGNRLWVGSVKTNIGHTESAAGIAGLIKTALALHHGEIPPSLHFKTPNPAINWEGMPVAVPTGVIPWPASRSQRLAGVSSYGIGGTNGHVVLEEAPRSPASLRSAATPPVVAVLPLSARSDGALRELSHAYARWIKANPTVSLDELCWNVATRRTALEHRAAFAAGDRSDLLAALAAYGSVDSTVTPAPAVHRRPRIAFVAPGQGGQWTGMARELFADAPVFRDTLEVCDRAARPYTDWSIVEELHRDATDAGYIGERIDVIQPTLVAVSIAYARWLQSIGIEPDAVVGHSLGEVAAAAIAGVVTLDDAMRIICTRSSLMQTVSGRGAMALVDLPADEICTRLEQMSNPISLAASNSPRSSVVSGDPEAIRVFVDTLKREDIFCRLVKVDVASHSSQMEPIALQLTRRLQGLQPTSGTLPVYSTVTAGKLDGSAFDASYWGRNLRQPVLFADAMARLLSDGVTVFIELGPHPVLVAAIEQNARALALQVVAMACGHRDEPDARSTARLCAIGWTTGVSVDWRRAMPGARRPLDLPKYPWQRQRYWMDGLVPASLTGTVRRPADLSGEARQWLLTPTWLSSPVTSAESGGTAIHWLFVGPDANVLAAPLERHACSVEAFATIADATSWIGVAPLQQGDDLGIVLQAQPDDHDAAWHAVDGLRSLQRAWARRQFSRAPRVWWVTMNAQRVPDAVEAGCDVQGSTVWGAARVLATEHPDWWGGLVDIGPNAATCASMLAAHLMASLREQGEDEVAIRDQHRYALRLTQAAAVSLTPFAWRADAAYLITGGHGGVAQQIAALMVREGARRIVLLSRTALPPRSTWAALDPTSDMGRRAAAVRTLEHAGASVHLLQVDVSNAAELEAALAQYQSEGWPAIRGVVHCAVVLDNRLTDDMDHEAFQRVMDPKVAGAQHLDQLLPELDLFVLFSSISAFWGPAGMANYAAANAGVDAVAEQRAARGQRAVSIQWAPWSNVGLHQDISAAQGDEDMQRSGISALEPDAATAIFSALARGPAPVVAVMPTDWQQYRRVKRGRSRAFFRLVANVREQQSVDVPVSFAERAARWSPAERRAHLEQVARQTLAEVLRLGATPIDARRPFGTMGLESLMAVELRNRLEVALERALPATLAWNFPTLSQLVAHLDTLFAGDPVVQPLVTVPGPAEGESVSDLLADFVSVSDEDAMRALRGEG